MIYLYTGNGQGKSSAAIGLGLRALGAGKKVLLLQFLKTPITSEARAIKKISNFDMKCFGRKGFFLPESYLRKYPHLLKKGVKPLGRVDSELVQKGLEFLRKVAKTKRYNLVILDEINLVLFFKLIGLREFLEIIKPISQKIDLILTGRKAPKELIKMADLVTEFRERKHPYQKGKKARKGLEF
jgi:cob(I)alamin adenosyltransferase